MSFFTISAAINAATSIVLGLFVYLKNRGVILNKIFAIFCLSVAVWASFWFLGLVLGTTKPITLLFTRVLNIAAIFIPITYFHFITVFLNIYQKKKRLVILGYLLAFILFISGFTPLFVRDVEPGVSFPWYPKPGITYHLFALMFFSFVIYSWYLMFQAIRKATGLTNLQIKYVLIGTLIGFIGGSTSFFPVYNVPIPPFGNGLVVIYVILATFAILKYHLFEIRVILTELLVGVMGIIWLIFIFLMPTFNLKILTLLTFFLFLIFGYYLIKTTHQESKRREEAERIAIRERALRI
ncbi:MAG: histidine kinase N-terminal 7TM domain-containing protein, partial [Patescibacteria group bacterium]|nr:histidine kinase N-terminal 7TM domain-containing protein [Patescibacteria group bacterium]